MGRSRSRSLVSFFKGRKKFAALMLGLWLVATGVVQLIQLHFLFMETILGVLAITAGVLLVLDR